MIICMCCTKHSYPVSSRFRVQVFLPWSVVAKPRLKVKVFFLPGMRLQKSSPTKWCRHVDFDHSLCGSFLDLNFSLGVDGCFCQQCHVAEGLPHGWTHAPAFRARAPMERAGTWNWKKKWHGNAPFLWWFSGRGLLRSFEFGWIWLGSTPQ